MKVKAVKGMKDILPGDVALWRKVESGARRTLASYGYGELRTPILESTQLFRRSIGEGTDIVSKEMYTFKEKGGGEVTLRPEATASVVRAYVEHHLAEKMGLAKLYSIGPMFRTERPQAGRQRQFHQISTEVIGSGSPWVDSEVIVMLSELLKRVGLTEYSIHLNSVGCPVSSCRPAFIGKLKAFVKAHLKSLGPECQARYPKRVWRILDCKNSACRRIMQKGPSLVEHIRTSQCDCRAHFDEVRRGLEAAGQSFELDPFLVRGLDYYTKTAFEVTAPGLGAQDAVAAGGRYDGLVKLLEGPDVGGVGMAIGLERLIHLLRSGEGSRVSDSVHTVYLALLGPKVMETAMPIARDLRGHAVTTHMNYDSGRSLKSQLREADRLGCRWVVMLGERELEKGMATVKDLHQHEQKEISISGLVSELTQRRGS